MEKELDQQQSQNIEYDKFGNVVINGKTFYSEESQNHFTQKLQEENKTLKSQIDTLNENFNQLQFQVNDKDRTQILKELGVKQEQIANVKKLTNDIPNEQLAEYVSNDRSFDIFRKSVFENNEQTKQQEQQPNTQETKKPRNKVLEWFNNQKL